MRVVTYRSLAGLQADYHQNLIRGWMFVNTRHPLAVGSSLRLVLALPSLNAHVAVEGVVHQVARFGNGLNDMPGMTIQLLSSQPIVELLHELARASPVRVTPVHQLVARM